MAGLRDWFSAGRDDGADPRWADHVTELLYDGETVTGRVEAGDARVVVTGQRVLAFTPDAAGPAFRQVDRPNVVRVTTGHRGKSGLRDRALRWGIVGIVLVGAGLAFDMDALVGDVSLGGGAGSQIGLGGVLGLMQTVLDLLSRLDEFLAVLGALVLALAVLAAGAWLLTRDPTIVLAVAGDDPDIHLPAGDDGPALAARLEAAIGPGGAADREA